ncbi:hypothetical protein JTE90_027917 [Oedothorax gibbosus]|uniref:Uncharacterized protein n=1 Tax=Oedothorax gibbosus TaxID=931172 RepID=A0AAV6U8B0_9ARAC|nr:hypothetical protein JTE90_027917 [Oedothorax gibbosus]
MALPLDNRRACAVPGFFPRNPASSGFSREVEAYELYEKEDWKRLRNRDDFGFARRRDEQQVEKKKTTVVRLVMRGLKILNNTEDALGGLILV